MPVRLSRTFRSTSPMSSELESLNVSVAHGILSYEAAQIQEDLK